MKNFFCALAMILVSSLGAFAQGQKSTASAPVKYDAEIALAKLALAAHGGEKLRTMNSLIMRGSLDFTTSAFNQAIPATFVVIIAKDKYRFEINNQFQPIKQVFDGVNTSTTIQGGMTLPPINRLGFPLLPMVGTQGFVITPLPESMRSKKGFRMTSPDGYHTDFFLDDKTNQIKGYEASYDISGRRVSTSVEIDKMRVVDGITVPEKYAQRFESEQITAYVVFKAKEILVNTPVADEIFTIK